jgi:hypothetical protein
MPKLVLARGAISPTDELVIVLSEPANEPAWCSSTGPQRRRSRHLHFPDHGEQDHHDRYQRRRTARTTQGEAAVSCKIRPWC